jgi:hypothetical protein
MSKSRKNTKKHQKTIKHNKSTKPNKSKRSRRSKKGGTLRDLAINSLLNSGVTPRMLDAQNYPQHISNLIRPEYYARVSQRCRRRNTTRRYWSRTNDAYAWQRFNNLRRNGQLSRTQLQSVLNYLINTVDIGALNASPENGTFWIDQTTNRSKEQIDDDIQELLYMADMDDEDDAEAGF